MHEFQTSGPCQFCNIANSTLPPAALWLVSGAPVSAALVSAGERAGTPAFAKLSSAKRQWRPSSQTCARAEFNEGESL